MQRDITTSPYKSSAPASILEYAQSRNQSRIKAPYENTFSPINELKYNTAHMPKQLNMNSPRSSNPKESVRNYRVNLYTKTQKEFFSNR